MLFGTINFQINDEMYIYVWISTLIFVHILYREDANLNYAMARYNFPLILKMDFLLDQ